MLLDDPDFYESDDELNITSVVKEQNPLDLDSIPGPHHYNGK
jgi:hypothetical protein